MAVVVGCECILAFGIARKTYDPRKPRLNSSTWILIVWRKILPKNVWWNCKFTFGAKTSIYNGKQCVHGWTLGYTYEHWNGEKRWNFATNKVQSVFYVKFCHWWDGKFWLNFMVWMLEWWRTRELDNKQSPLSFFEWRYRGCVALDSIDQYSKLSQTLIQLSTSCLCVLCSDDVHYWIGSPCCRILDDALLQPNKTEVETQKHCFLWCLFFFSLLTSLAAAGVWWALNFLNNCCC